MRHLILLSAPKNEIRDRGDIFITQYEKSRYRFCMHYPCVFSRPTCSTGCTFTCGSEGEARRDGAAWTPRTSRTHPHHLVLTLQTDDLVLLVFSDVAAAHVLAPGLDLHTLFADLTESHVCSRLTLQHPLLHRRQSHLLRTEATSPAGKASLAPPTALDPGACFCLSSPPLRHVSFSRVMQLCDAGVAAARGW